MAVLTHDVIMQEIESGRISIDPFDPDCVGPASIDLSLGDTIRIIKASDTPIPIHDDVDYRDHTDPLRLDEPYFLKPGAMIHGITREKVTLPPNICGFLEGRSRFARLGLTIHVSSSFLQPGVSNRTVLELSNLSGHPLEIYAGVRLCQLVLVRTEGEAIYTGQFCDQEEV